MRGRRSRRRERCAHVGLGRRARAGESGQASVEYLLVGLVLMALVVALAALWHATSDGSLAALVQQSASHALGQGGGIVDALLY